MKEAYPYADDVIQHLLEREEPGLNNNGEDAHDVERKPPDRNKATKEEHPSPELEIDDPLHHSTRCMTSHWDHHFAWDKKAAVVSMQQLHRGTGSCTMVTGLNRLQHCTHFGGQTECKLQTGVWTSCVFVYVQQLQQSMVLSSIKTCVRHEQRGHAPV